MKKCFVMQPFDNNGPYDQRYESVFEPAIAAASLKPYRVDNDPSVIIPINEIEKGIRNSTICFAEISTDNPNVWYELGYAHAVGRKVIMVCSDERKTKYPFDVQHYNIIKYEVKPSQGYDILKDNITKRLKSVINTIENIQENVSIKNVDEANGLTSHEIVAIVSLMTSCMSCEYAPVYQIVDDMNGKGFTNTEVCIALRSLSSKGMIISKMIEDEYNNGTYKVYQTTRKGDEWIFANQDKIKLYDKYVTDEIPF